MSPSDPPIEDGPPGEGQPPAGEGPPDEDQRPAEDESQEEPDFSDSMALFARYRAEGDTEALNRLFERYRSRLSRKVSILMSSRVQARFEASDIAQSVLVRGYQNLERFEFRDPGSLMRWLSTIALNSIRNKGRLVGRRGEQELDALDQLDVVDLDGPERRADRPVDQLERDELQALTDQAITSLSEDHRTVLLHRTYDGSAWAEVGALMGRTADAAQQLHRRALVELRRELARRGVN